MVKTNQRKKTKRRRKTTDMFLLIKKIHRALVWIIITLGLVMGGTGLLLKFPAFADSYFSFFVPVQIRYLHNQISVYFSIALALMMITGIWMYIYPAWTGWQHRHGQRNDH